MQRFGGILQGPVSSGFELVVSTPLSRFIERFQGERMDAAAAGQGESILNIRKTVSAGGDFSLNFRSSKGKRSKVGHLQRKK